MFYIIMDSYRYWFFQRTQNPRSRETRVTEFARVCVCVCMCICVRMRKRRVGGKNIRGEGIGRCSFRNRGSTSGRWPGSNINVGPDNCEVDCRKGGLRSRAIGQTQSPRA